MEIYEGNGFGIARMRVKESDNNYNYIAYCAETKESVVIDPLDVRVLLDFIRENNLKVKYIINTHAHPDHIEGNDALMKVTASKILIHRLGKDYVSPRSQTIDEGDIIDVGSQQIKVIHTPGHCPEHVSLILGNNAFVGDTLFLSGCGNTRFRGNVSELYETIAFKLRTLPEDFRLFFGHNYAEKNLTFALNIEPENKAAKAKLDEVRISIREGKETPPTTIGEERQYNPFLRFDEPSIVNELRKRNPSLEETPEAIFKELRELRNKW